MPHFADAGLSEKFPSSIVPEWAGHDDAAQSPRLGSSVQIVAAKYPKNIPR